jgi:hypothetical protein
MAKFNIKELLEKHTSDGEVDYTKVNEELETQNRNIVVKESSKEIDKIKEETLASMIKELGVEGTNLEDVKLYIKQVSGSTDEAKEEVIRLTTEFNKLKKDYDSGVDKLTKIETETKDKKQTDLIKSMGVTEDKQVEFFKWDFNRQVTEDNSFEDVVSAYAKANDITTTQHFVKDEFGHKGTNDMDIGEAFLSKREKRTRK